MLEAVLKDPTSFGIRVILFNDPDLYLSCLAAFLISYL